MDGEYDIAVESGSKWLQIIVSLVEWMDLKNGAKLETICFKQLFADPSTATPITAQQASE